MSGPDDLVKKLQEQQRAVSPLSGIREALQMKPSQASLLQSPWLSSLVSPTLPSRLSVREQLRLPPASMPSPLIPGLSEMVARVGQTPVHMASLQTVLRDHLRVVRPDMLLGGRTAWARGVEPLLQDVQQQLERFLLAQKELDRDLERDARFVMDHFEQEGWHLFPLFWVEDFLLPKILRRKLDEGPAQAKAEVMARMISNGEALKAYMTDRALTLNLPDEERDRRLEAVFNQFDQVCRGEAKESAASVMIGQAEGFFNAVTGPLGLEKGAFYTSHQGKIKRREQVLDSLHATIPQSGDYLAPEFDRRKYEHFKEARDKSIPIRNALQHGSGLDYWTQEHALWATSFLILTLEYLEALCRSRHPVQA